MYEDKHLYNEDGTRAAQYKLAYAKQFVGDAVKVSKLLRKKTYVDCKSLIKTLIRHTSLMPDDATLDMVEDHTRMPWLSQKMRDARDRIDIGMSHPDAQGHYVAFHNIDNRDLYYKLVRDPEERSAKKRDARRKRLHGAIDNIDRDIELEVTSQLRREGKLPDRVVNRYHLQKMNVSDLHDDVDRGCKRFDKANKRAGLMDPDPE